MPSAEEATYPALLLASDHWLPKFVVTLEQTLSGLNFTLNAPNFRIRANTQQGVFRRRLFQLPPLMLAIRRTDAHGNNFFDGSSRAPGNNRVRRSANKRGKKNEVLLTGVHGSKISEPAKRTSPKTV